MERSPIWVRALACSAGLVALMWCVELANYLEGHVFWSWGILPRTKLGLRGIVFAPFIHYSINHLILNSAPLAFLSWLVLTKGTTNFLRVSLTVLLTSGFLVWALARPQYHIGASGLVLGYFSYLVTNSLIERSWSALLMGAATVLIYGGLLLTVLPMEGEVSWENHLAGLVAGALAAIVLVPNEKEKR